MSIGNICCRKVTTIGRDDSVLQAARLMREQHVGDVVITASGKQDEQPLGILTDRDIVLEFVARELDLAAFTVGDAMGDRLITVAESMSLVDGITKMRSHGIRRAPVVDDAGRLVGIVTVDDIITILAEEMKDLAALVRKGCRMEKKRRA